MRKAFFKELPAYQFHLFQKFSDSFEHAIFTRKGGVSKKPFDTLNVRFGIGDNFEDVVKNRSIICRALGVDDDKLISADQTHGKNIQIVDENFLKNREGCDYDEDAVSGVDAFVTHIPSVALMIQVADCQAILMYDPIKKVAAAIHAGWKGLAQNISLETIKIMVGNYGCDPSTILVGISPSLGPCCSFFTDPKKELPAGFHKYVDKEKKVDMWAFSVDQLVSAGIQNNHIESARICTQCNNGQTIEGGGRFFSFRGEKGITGRFGAVISVK